MRVGRAAQSIELCAALLGHGLTCGARRLREPAAALPGSPGRTCHGWRCGRPRPHWRSTAGARRVGADGFIGQTKLWQQSRYLAMPTCRQAGSPAHWPVPEGGRAMCTTLTAPPSRAPHPPVPSRRRTARRAQTPPPLPRCQLRRGRCRAPTARAQPPHGSRPAAHKGGQAGVCQWVGCEAEAKATEAR